jgi:hypothetical protein
MSGLPLNQIIHGNCLEVMRQFPDKSSYQLRDEANFMFLQDLEKALPKGSRPFTGKKKTLKGFAL